MLPRLQLSYIPEERPHADAFVQIIERREYPSVLGRADFVTTYDAGGHINREWIVVEHAPPNGLILRSHHDPSLLFRVRRRQRYVAARTDGTIVIHHGDELTFPSKTDCDEEQQSASSSSHMGCVERALTTGRPVRYRIQIFLTCEACGKEIIHLTAHQNFCVGHHMTIDGSDFRKTKRAALRSIEEARTSRQQKRKRPMGRASCKDDIAPRPPDADDDDDDWLDRAEPPTGSPRPLGQIMGAATR